MEKFNIKFGKYSKNGFMFISKNGTVMNIADTDYNGSPSLQTSFSDGINGATTTEADSSTGTIVAYSEGKWTAAGTNLTGTNLEGKSTEIKVNKKLDMTSKNGIAFVADNGGKVTVNKDVKAHGYGSLIGYAKTGATYNDSTVYIDGNVKAVDSGVSTLTEKYKNIGAYAEDTNAVSTPSTKTTVTVTGNTVVNGIGAIAKGNDAVVNLNGTANDIKTGVTGGLYATGGGTINFGGGTIENKEITTGSHSNTTPFYSASNSKINFNGATTIDMYNGVLIYDNPTDYDGSTSGTYRYNGMNNVTVNLQSDDVLIYTVDGGTTNWMAPNTISTKVKNDMKLGAFNTNGHSFKAYYINGLFNINTNVNLDGGTSTLPDEFKNIVFLKEKITISPGILVTSTNGKGMSLASVSGASNTDSGYDNYGTIDITGGITTDTVALGVANGYVNNYNEIKLDTGVGVYGTNGSILKNNSTGKIEISGSGEGIVGKVLGTGINYGANAVEIINDGTIKISGNNSTGIYAENSIINLNSNYGIETKDNGIGIYSTGNSVLSTPVTLNYKYSGTNTGVGIATYYNGTGIAGTGATNNLNINLNNSTNTTAGILAILADGGGTFINNRNINGTSNVNEFGIVSDNNTDITNNGNITLSNSLNLASSNVGIYSKLNNAIINNGNISVGDNSIGIYGYKINHQLSKSITTGNGGVAIYSQDGDVTIDGNINVGTQNALALYTKGSGQIINVNGNINMGDSSFGIVNQGTGNTITTTTPTVNLNEDNTFIYSEDTTGSIVNNTSISSIGNNNYGIYSYGRALNNANISMDSGIGNVGIYSVGGVATNSSLATIKVGNSDTLNKNYGMGMVATDGGQITNNGIIDVNGYKGIGMYGKGTNTVVTNNGTINLNQNSAIGIYLDEGAKGFNNGIITTVGSGLSSNVGIMVMNGSEFTNNGTVTIDSSNGYGLIVNGGVIKNYGVFNISGGAAKELNVGSTPSNPISQLPVGMYIDTSGEQFTNPIAGLGNIGGLSRADLIIGAEITRKRLESDLVIIGTDPILSKYNALILSTPSVKTWDVYSGSILWKAIADFDDSIGTISKVTMTRKQFTSFADDLTTTKNTYNFLDGLEQRYGVEGIGTREKELFSKMDKIGNSEPVLLYQAFDEMMGHQYANTNARISQDSSTLKKGFDDLFYWQTKSKDSNKIKLIAGTNEYKTDTAGVVDYKTNHIGVVYLREDETMNLGKSQGWYGGLLYDQFEFKDLGKSKENSLSGTLGLYKSIPFDYNNSLNWTIKGDVKLGYRQMDRKYIIVDEIFNAKSNYYTYGASLENEVSKTIRLNKMWSLKPYGAINIEYGKHTSIKEKKGEIKLELPENDYYSIKPSLGAELSYNTKYARFGTLKILLGGRYEQELGNVFESENKIKVRDTSADYFNLRSDKANDGTGVFDAKMYIENGRLGLSLGTSYSTEASEVQGTAGFRWVFYYKK